MNKHWAALLLAIVATQAVADEKEYTIKICEQAVAKMKDCSQCMKTINTKTIFKVSNELKSVMRTNVMADGSTNTYVIENCKIFDENNFQCKTVTAYSYSKAKIDLGTETTLTVANGKWENIGIDYGAIDTGNVRDSKITYNCGEEILSSFNFFK